jgi:hypothetical protein
MVTQLADQFLTVGHAHADVRTLRNDWLRADKANRSI